MNRRDADRDRDAEMRCLREAGPAGERGLSGPRMDVMQAEIEDSAGVILPAVAGAPQRSGLLFPAPASRYTRREYPLSGDQCTRETSRDAGSTQFGLRMEKSRGRDTSTEHEKEGPPVPTKSPSYRR